MPRKRATGTPSKRSIERYEHTDKKRINIPPVGLVTPKTDPIVPTHKVYDCVAPVPSAKPRQELGYDPHLDPQTSYNEAADLISPRSWAIMSR